MSLKASIFEPYNETNNSKDRKAKFSLSHFERLTLKIILSYYLLVINRSSQQDLFTRLV